MKILSNYNCLSYDDREAFPRYAHFEFKTFGPSTADHFTIKPAEDFAQCYRDRVLPQYQPDFILFYWPEYRPMPLNFHLAPVPKFAVVSGWNVGVNILPYLLPLFHGAFCDKNGVEVLRRMGCEQVRFWQQYASFWGIHKLRPEEPKIYDVGFIGNLNSNLQKNREQWLKRLALLGGRYKVGMFGGVYGEEYAKTLSRCKITFNHSIRGEMNLRSWEAPACGSLLFMEDRNDEIRDYLEPGKEVVLYTEKNFDDLLQYYLDHDAERENMVESARQKLEKYRFAVRFAELLDHIRKLLASGPPPASPHRGIHLSYALFQNKIETKQKLVFHGIQEGESKLDGQRQLCLMGHRVWDQVKTERPHYRTAVEQAYVRQLEEFPDDLVTFLNYGKFLRNNGEWKKALDVFIRGLELLAKNPDLKPHLTGLLYPVESDYEKGLWFQACVEVYQAGMNTLPLQTFFKSRFLFYASFCFCRLEIYDQALHFIQKAVRAKTDMSDAWALEGEIRFLQLDYIRSADCFARAITISPLNLEYYICAANCYRRLNLMAEEGRIVAEAKKIRANIQNYDFFDPVLEDYDRKWGAVPRESS